jgi:putative salt-induced outer membrane protein YdiY
VLQTADMLLSVEAGPGYRVSRQRSPLSDQKKVYGRGVVNFEYILSQTAKFTNEFSLKWDSDRKKVENTLAVTSKLVGSLAGRASVNYRYNSDPPARPAPALPIKKTDTVSKLALVYSF